MDARQLTCEVVDADALDVRYLAGTLPPAEAEAFEAHYFGCERCWRLVQQGLGLRAAKGTAPVAAAPSRRGLWIGLAAASVLVVSTMVWRSPRPVPGGDDALRGVNAAMVASASVRADSIVAMWATVSGAVDYRVRISAPDGTALFEREVTDPAITLPRSALSGAMADTVYVSVLARDALRRPLARSALTPLALPKR